MMRNGEEAEEGKGEEIEEDGEARGAGPEKEGHEDEKREDQEREEEDGAQVAPEGCAGSGQQPGSRSGGRRRDGRQRRPIRAERRAASGERRPPVYFKTFRAVALSGAAATPAQRRLHPFCAGHSMRPR